MCQVRSQQIFFQVSPFSLIYILKKTQRRRERERVREGEGVREREYVRERERLRENKREKNDINYNDR